MRVWVGVFGWVYSQVSRSGFKFCVVVGRDCGRVVFRV